MKLHYPSCVWLAVASGFLAASVAQNPPGHVSWTAFFLEATPASAKLWYLAEVYLWPAFLAFWGVTLFQLQFRLSASGMPAAGVFGISVLASTAMLAGLRAAALSPNAAPAYVLGMALSYTMLSRLYAVHMRAVWKSVRLPWLVWRGNRAAVEEIDRRAVAARRGTASL